MSVYAQPGQTGVVAVLSGSTAGLVGTIGIAVKSSAGAVVTARTTSGIIDIGGGAYAATLTAPSPTTPTTYIIEWDTGGGSPIYTVEDFQVGGAAPVSTPNAGDHCTLADAREYCLKESTETSQDTLIAHLITRVSGLHESYCRRQLTDHGASTHTFEVRQVPRRIIDFVPRELRTPTSVVLHPESTSPVTLVQDVDYTLYPIDGAALGGTFFQIEVTPLVSLASVFYTKFRRARLQVTGSWGCGSVHPDVNAAALMTVQHLFRRVTAYSTRVNEDTEALIRPDMIPFDARAALRDFRRVIL